MNLKLSRLTLVLFLGLPYFTSCSNDDLSALVSEEENLPVSRSSSEKGRFDFEPFQWDYFISTNPEKNHLMKSLYILLKFKKMQPQ